MRGVCLPFNGDRVLRFCRTDSFVPLVRTSVSNEDLGRLRVQFYREAIAAILASDAADPARSPVLEALAEGVGRYPGVRFKSLHALLDARERDLAYPNIASLGALEKFAADTQGVCIGLHAEALGGVDIGIAASAAGKAVGLAVVLRGAPAHAVSRLSYAPRDLVKDFNVSSAELLSGSGDAAKVFEVVASAAGHWRDVALGAVESLSSDVKPAFWGLNVTNIYLRRLKKAGYNPFDERLQRGMLSTYPLALQLSMLKARLFNR